MMNICFRRIVLLIVAVGLVSCVAGTEVVEGPEETPVTVSVNSWPGFGPLYIAQAQGYFEEQGLDVEIVLLEGGAERRAGFIGGRIDILGASLDDFAVTVDRGADAVAIGCADFSNGADGIVAGGPIRGLEDLATAEVAVEPGLPNHFFLLYVLDRNDLPTTKVEIVPMEPGDAGSAFIAGHIDAAVTWEPHLSRALKERVDAQILARSSEYPEAILDLFIAPKEWVVEHPELPGKFRNAWDKAVEYLEENPEEATTILADRLALEPSEVREILSGIKILASPECKDLVIPQVESLSTRVESLWREAGFLDSDVKLVERFWLQK